VAVAGEPVGFVIPFLQGNDLRFVGLGATLRTQLGVEIAARIASASTLRILMLGGDPQAARQLAAFGIAPDQSRCTRIETGRRNWGAILLCHVMTRN
jgi:hypothetical protein